MHEDPESNRDWEHWPGRKSGDDGIRHRLKALFSATEGDDGLEARIEEKGLEIEEHADQLQATIGDLERREERTGQLRAAVEEMLRKGSAELDERHAGLTRLSLELAAREEAVRAAERDIAVRKQELGAVELRRAAVERREGLAAEREEELEQRAAELNERERTPGDGKKGSAAALVALPAAEADHEGFDGNVLFVTDQGYRMLDRPGPAAPVGSAIDIDGSSYVVVRTGRSPLPGDRRRFAYAEPLSTAGRAEP